jgi:glycosyltransferase involved in cell wall biosynthesis
MNLFIDAHLFDSPPEGSRTYIKGLYSELIEKNPSIYFYFAAFNTQELRDQFGVRENVKYLKYFSRNKFLRLVLNIPFLIVKNNIDLAHYQYITPLIKCSREIVTIHDLLFLDFPELFPSSYRIRNRFLFKRSAFRADFLLTVSEYSKKSISRHFNIREDKVHVIPNGISDEFFERDKPLPDIKIKYSLEKYILYVSRIEPRKNHFTLLKAFTELNLWQKGFKLVFVGRESIKSPELDKYLNNLPSNIRESVIKIESSQGNELMSFYRNCSLFVYPSFGEGFGIPPLEAAASEVPVLCSDSTAMNDFNFLVNSLFNPASLEDLKEKMMKILNGEENDLKGRMEFIKTNYNWSKSALRFSELILHDRNIIAEIEK